MDCEVLLPAEISQRGGNMLRAMIDAAPAAGVNCIVGEVYKKAAPVLMSYGLGHPVRRPWIQDHLKRGGRVVGWDLSYWDRETAMRLTLDQDHPQKHVNAVDMPGHRWTASGFELRNDANPSGPVILCGLGRKQRELKGWHGQAWELSTLKAIKKALPGKEVLYRPKRPEGLKRVRTVAGPIEQALRGASLVVCAHSNVAIDACIAGVPVVCWDGAAAALYGSDLRAPAAPNEAERLRFLQNLAWWQWKPEEAIDAWTFLKTRL